MTIKRLFLILVLFILACGMAGLHGAIHNQISYSISPEYFTCYKFPQFRISETLYGRLGAAIVGWKAAWWMGLLIGLVLIPWGSVRLKDPAFFRMMLLVFSIVTVTALIVGFAALGVAMFVLDENNVGEISRFGNAIEKGVAFQQAGTMHNFSYLGGFIGLLVGVVIIGIAPRRIRELGAQQTV